MKLLILIFIALNVFAQTPEALEYPFYYERHDFSANNSHQVQIIENGLESFQLRLDLIRSAKESIEVEYFILNDDLAGRLFMQELAIAAKRGVEVRVLIDKSVTVVKLDDYIGSEFEKFGGELRFYNPRSDLSSMQFRTHRKILAIDKKVVLTGGRNIGEEYFDMSGEFNFLDRDILVKGEVVSAIVATFDEYWNHKLSQKVKTPKIVKPARRVSACHKRHDCHIRRSKYRRYKKYVERTTFAKGFFTRSDEDRAILERIEGLTRRNLESIQTHACPELTFATDKPGARLSTVLKDDFTDKYRGLRKVFSHKVSKLNESLVIDSPYIINNKDTKILMNALLEMDVEFKLYTNSLGSTDAVYVAANFYTEKERFRKAGMDIHLHEGNYFSQGPVLFNKIKKAKWGTHSKSHIYDGDEIMIGTYNIDNRSNFYNSEMAIFCKGNPELTRELEDNIQARIDQGLEIIAPYKAIDKNGKKVGIYGNSTLIDNLVMRLIALPSILAKDLL